MKKRFMGMISMLMVLVMTLGMCVTGYAADANTYTITISNSVKDETYTAYKVFDATYSEDGENIAYTISVSSEWYNLVNAEGSPFSLTEAAGQTGTYVVGLKEDKEDSDVIAWFNGLYSSGLLNSMNDKVEGTGTGATLVLDVSNLEAGYYFVTSSVGATVSLTPVAPKAEIIEKNNKPGEGGDGFTKVAGNGTGDHSYTMGDEVPYTITAYVPTYAGDKEVIKYTITDTMGKGLIYNNDIAVTIDGVTLVKDTDYTVETSTATDGSGSTILTITWEPGKIENYPANGNITITYTATVDEAADEIDLENSVTLAWYTDDGEDPEDSTTTTEHIYTYGFGLKKIDGSTSTEDEPTALDGAKFTLQKDGSGDLISFIYDEAANTYEVWDGQSLTAGQTTTTEIEVIDGKVNIWGLGTGEYILTETEAPAGYNLLSSTVTIVISDTETTDSNGNVTSTSWKITVDGEEIGSGTIDAESEHGVAGDSIPVVTIENNAGTSLPSTGGIGTTIFYVVGAFFVLAAAALVVTKMRLGKTE